MTILSWLEDALTVTEKDVVAIIVKVKQGVALAESEISAALGWIANNASVIASDVQQVSSILLAAGTIDPAVAPEVQAAVAAANLAVAGLNTFASAYNSGAGTVQSVVAGYTAIKNAQSAVAKAAAVAVSAPTASISATSAATPISQAA